MLSFWISSTWIPLSVVGGFSVFYACSTNNCKTDTLNYYFWKSYYERLTRDDSLVLVMISSERRLVSLINRLQVRLSDDDLR